MAVLFVPSNNLSVPIVLLTVCGLAMKEFYQLLWHGGIPASRRMGIISGLLLVAMTWFCLWRGISSDILLALFSLILLIHFSRLLINPNTRQAIQNTFGTLFGFIYIALFWSFFVRIYMLGPPDKPGLSAFYLLLSVKWGDAGAYFIGSHFGKHKLLPRISPQKSWEGLFGGILFSCIVGILWWTINGGKLGELPFPFHHALILGVLLPIIGTLGDLVESLFKRAVDVKDSGVMAYGLGGILDMIDSLLFTAPFLYIYIKFFLAH